METLRLERLERLADLDRNTIAMRLIAVTAQTAGLSAYRIAIMLGVTNRTVYRWLKNK
jgi:transposase